jgi:hypothetical protein
VYCGGGFRASEFSGRRWASLWRIWFCIQAVKLSKEPLSRRNQRLGGPDEPLAEEGLK